MYDERKKCGVSKLAIPKSHQSYVLMTGIVPVGENLIEWSYFLQLSRR
jgi:hypothetical protein